MAEKNNSLDPYELFLDSNPRDLKKKKSNPKDDIKENYSDNDKILSLQNSPQKITKNKKIKYSEVIGDEIIENSNLSKDINKNKVLSDSENSQDELEDLVEDNIEADDYIPVNIKPKTFNIKGNGNLHYLPFKINYNGYTPVDQYFESLIKDNDKNPNIKKTSYRGRIFNGLKIKTYKDINSHNETDTNLGVFIANMESGSDNKIYFNKKENLENYYIWKYDEDLNLYKNQNLININKIICDLNKLG